MGRLRRPSPSNNRAGGDGIYRSHWKEYFDLGFIPYPASLETKAPLIKWRDEYPRERVAPRILGMVVRFDADSAMGHSQGYAKAVNVRQFDGKVG